MQSYYTASYRAIPVALDEGLFSMFWRWPPKEEEEPQRSPPLTAESLWLNADKINITVCYHGRPIVSIEPILDHRFYRLHFEIGDSVVVAHSAILRREVDV